MHIWKKRCFTMVGILNFPFLMLLAVSEAVANLVKLQPHTTANR